jgi:serine/threonine-protein kinase OSR1/STK39
MLLHDVLLLPNQRRYDASADIWSFGITLMELALGKPPLAKMNPMRVILSTVNSPPPRLEDSQDGRTFSKVSLLGDHHDVGCGQ